MTVLHDLLRASAERDPDALAVKGDRDPITYGDLLRAAGSLTLLLRDRGVEPGDRVALLPNRGSDSFVAVYGILGAGAAYVPIDPEAPPERQRSIVNDCGVKGLILEGAANQRRAGHLIPPGTFCFAFQAEGDASTQVEALSTRDLVAAGGEESGPGGSPDDLAYILYTSGSTGGPKGVALTHANALAFVDWATRHVGVSPGDVLSNHAPWHFDLSTFDLFSAAQAGACVAPVPRATAIFPLELARFIAEKQITIWYSVPSALTMLARAKLPEANCDSVRHVLFAGEVFPPKHLRAAMATFRKARFSNLYGPTETNVCTSYEVPRPWTREEAIPIGKPIDDVRVSVVDEDLQPVEVGASGEIVVQGPTVMQGYWGRPDLTDNVLIRIPSLGDEPAYRTGDLGFYDDDTDLHLIGRRDSQVKVRGYRIELGEIESTLLRHQAVVEAAIVPRGDEDVFERLEAHVVAVAPVDPTELIDLCSRHLPRYMVPEVWEFHDILPKTSTGKVDRNLLRGMQDV